MKNLSILILFHLKYIISFFLSFFLLVLVVNNDEKKEIIKKEEITMTKNHPRKISKMKQLKKLKKK